MILTALSLAACDGDPDCLAVECACTSNDTCRPLGPGSQCVEGQCRLPFDAGARPDGGMDAGGDDAGFDGGFIVDEDTGVLDAGTSETGPPVGVGDSLANLFDPDFSCLGSRTAPPTGATGPATYRVAEFAGSRRAQGTGVWFFADNVPRTTCSPSDCQNLTSDSAGSINAQAPSGGWIAYYSLGGQALFEGVLIDVLPVAGVNMDGIIYSVPIELRDEMTANLGFVVPPDTSTLVGQVLDCSNQPIANAVVRLFDGTREIDLSNVPPRPLAFYWDGITGIDSMRARTATDGRWGVTNLSVPASGSYRVELWGARGAPGALERLGCEDVPVVPGGFGIVDVGPQRIDGPC